MPRCSNSFASAGVLPRRTAFSLRRTSNSPEETTLSRTMRLAHTRPLFLLVALSVAASAGAQRPSAAAGAGASSIPTPESVIGFPVGEDFKLFTYDQSIDYFRKLAAA